MWSHVPGVPRAWSFSFSWALISRTLSAMVFTFSLLQAQWETPVDQNPLHTGLHTVSGDARTIRRRARASWEWRPRSEPPEWAGWTRWSWRSSPSGTGRSSGGRGGGSRWSGSPLARLATVDYNIFISCRYNRLKVATFAGLKLSLCGGERKKLWTESQCEQEATLGSHWRCINPIISSWKHLLQLLTLVTLIVHCD